MDKNWLDTISAGLDEVIASSSLSADTYDSLLLVTGEEGFGRLPTEPGNGMVNILLLVRRTADSLLQLGSCPGNPAAALDELMEGLCAVEGLAQDDEEGLELKPLDESPEPADPLGGRIYTYGSHLASESGKHGLAVALSLRASYLKDRQALRRRLYDSVLYKRPD